MKKKNILTSLLMSLFSSVKKFFSFERGPCMIMQNAKIKFKAIPVSYPLCIVEGVERAPRLKIWNVAVKTVHPDFYCRTHAEWMIEIQFTHANIHSIIAEYERMEVLSGLRTYSLNIPMRSPASIKNN